MVFKPGYLNFTNARNWFIKQNRELLATDDNAGKRRAWAACIDGLIKEDAVVAAQARRWMYPSDLDTYRPPQPEAAIAQPVAPEPVLPEPMPTQETAPVSVPRPMSNQQLLEMLLQMNANELIQPAFMSVEIDGETHYRPILEIVQLQEPFFKTETGISPVSGLSEDDKMQHLEQVFSAGQLLFSYHTTAYDDVPADPADSAVPDRE